MNISKRLPIPEPHSKRKAQSIINDLSKDSANIGITTHCSERMLERGFLYNDVITILQEGVVLQEPRFDENKRSWKYRVDFIGFDDNRDAACVVAIQKKVKYR